MKHPVMAITNYKNIAGIYVVIYLYNPITGNFTTEIMLILIIGLLGVF